MIDKDVEVGVICPKRMKCQTLECPHAAIHVCNDISCKEHVRNNFCSGNTKPKCVEYSEEDTFGERLGLWQIIYR